MNEKTISDEMVVRGVREAVKIALGKNRAMDVPNIVYDRKTKKIYALQNNGERVFIADRALKGRYSERAAQEA